MAKLFVAATASDEGVPCGVTTTWSTTAFRFDCSAGSVIWLALVISRTAGILERARSPPFSDSTAFQVGTRPLSVFSGDAVVSQRHDSRTMNPERPAAATRNP